MKNYLILLCFLTLGCFNNKISEKVDYHYNNKGRKTSGLLEEAIRLGDIAKLEALIRAGENPSSVMSSAIYRNNLEIIKTLIRLGAKVNQLMTLGRTPIEFAASKGNVEIVTELLAAGAKVNLQQAFINAADAGHYEIVAVLFNYIRDVNYSKEGSRNALTCAASRGHLKIVEFLIKHGADVNYQASQNTPLSAAASNGHLAVVKLLIENGANIDLKIGEKTALLEAAASYRSFEVAEYLLSIGATFTEKEGPILAYLAARRGSISGIDALIKKGAKINVSDLEITYGQSYNPPLIEATRHGNVELVNFLLMNGADPNIRDKYGCTPLLTVIDSHIHDGADVKIAELLISAGADVNYQASQNTPLSAAVKKGHLAVVKLLIENGANIDLKIGEKTALIEAASYRSFEVAEYLLSIGATFTEKEGAILAYLATCRGSISGIDALIKKGAKINISDLEITYGQSYNPPLIEAASLGNIELVNFLLMNGADPNIRDKYGCTPLLTVIDSDIYHGADVKIAELLISAGADVNAVIIKTHFKERVSILNEAIKKVKFPMIKLLIDSGTIPDDSTFNLAIKQLSRYEKELDKIIELLASRNASIVEFVEFSGINQTLEIYNKLADLKTTNGYRLFNIPSSSGDTAIGVMLNELCNTRKQLPCFYPKLTGGDVPSRFKDGYAILTATYNLLLKTFIKILSEENKKRVSLTLRHICQQEVVENIIEFMDYKADEAILDKLVEKLIIDNKEEEATKYDIYKVNSALASLRDLKKLAL